MDLVKNRNYYSCSYYHHGRGGASGVYAILNWGPWNTGVPKEFFQWDPNMKNNLYGVQGTLCHCYLVKLFCIDLSKYILACTMEPKCNPHNGI